MTDEKMCLDLAELQRARDKLLATNQRLEEVARELKDAQRIAHVGSWTWRIDSDSVEWSDELTRLHGLAPSHSPIHRADAERLLSPESAEELNAAVDRAVAAGTSFELDLELIRPNGSHQWITTHGEAEHDPAGRVVMIRGTALDITRLKDLERMKQQWTSVLAHDLRETIGTILMSVELAPDLHQGPMNEAEAANTARIESSAAKLIRIVDSLLDVARIDAHRVSLQWTLVDPQAILGETVRHFAHLIGTRRVAISAEGEAKQILVDPVRFDQIMGNLITNAVRYSDRDTDVLVHIAHRDTEVEFSVSNFGAGIPAKEIPHLFTRFSRTWSDTARGSPGLGLGLFVTKGLVDAHRGRIWAESVPGGRTTFHVSLPSGGAALQAA
ncbi:MAG TPA: PAS domain-containing sensor histidine kinase [Gemmatimonadaceae bacterium]|nr:PAS domain-containing sensor histidine kinase [Gemmatimonadaceae bacterium]